MEGLYGTVGKWHMATQIPLGMNEKGHLGNQNYVARLLRDGTSDRCWQPDAESLPTDF